MWTAKTDQTGWMPKLIESSLGCRSFYWFCHVGQLQQNISVILYLNIFFPNRLSFVSIERNKRLIQNVE